MRSASEKSSAPPSRTLVQCPVVLLLIACVSIALGTLATSTAKGGVPRVGGCRTVERAYGLPALTDSVAHAATQELLAPGAPERERPLCRALGVTTPLFVQVGAVDSLDDRLWASVAGRIGEKLAADGVHLAMRSGLRHTTGPCFPPFHVDLRACGDSASVAVFLDELDGLAWEGLLPADDHGERVLFVSAGTSLQLMDHVVHLRRYGQRKE
ncbi:MAG: hypothetical protein KAY32_00115 [Candidatus Eisenbacteria sp.]|nr:hypothetical protein [Candidatus Eisenbacteria bacterium]